MRKTPRSPRTLLVGMVATMVATTGLALQPAAVRSAAADPVTTETSKPADGLAEGLDLVDLANRGEGWLRYRIPALTTAPNGDLLAFYDGRPSMADLPSNIAMLMRRSSDGETPPHRRVGSRHVLLVPRGTTGPAVVPLVETSPLPR